MNMHLIDWGIVVALTVILTFSAIFTKRYTRSVADFLAANRCGGRYLISVAGGMAGLGVITMVLWFQIGFDAGFTSKWWPILQEPVLIIMGITGWVIYRFRQTRAMTLAQYFEIRYSRNFRVFAGIIAFVALLLNFGIFPSVGARFFIALCGFGESFDLLGSGWILPTYPTIMAVLLGISVVFTFLGGQIAIMLTDFIQGTFCYIVFAVVILFLFFTFSWGQISETLLAAPAGKSLLNPYDIGKQENFNLVFYLIEIFILFYAVMGWQGEAAYKCSAKSPHENKMAVMLTNWRFRVLMIITLIIPLCVKTYLNHADFAPQAAVTQVQLEEMSDKTLLQQDVLNNDAGQEGAVVEADPENIKRKRGAIISQIQIPLVLAELLPAGLLGLFCAALLGAFISTHDTYLHSSGSMLIQDVILPFKKKSFTPRQHLWLLRVAILGVAVFIFFFSLKFEHAQRIIMYTNQTAGMFVAGAGSVIIGGLYWKRGTTAAAWVAMITGLSLSVLGIVMTQNRPDTFEQVRTIPFWADLGVLLGKINLDGFYWRAAETIYGLTGQVITFWCYIICIILYVLVSLLGRRQEFNMDRMLHRGKYAVAGEESVRLSEGETFWQKIGITREFTRSDKVVAAVTLGWPAAWLVVFLVGNVIQWYFSGSGDGSVSGGISDIAWSDFWCVWMWLVYLCSVGVTIWFTIGGFKDIRYLFEKLRSQRTDVHDDGRVEHEAED